VRLGTCIEVSASREAAWGGRSSGGLGVFRLARLGPSRGSFLGVVIAGPYRAVDGPTRWAAGRQIWVPPIPERRHWVNFIMQCASIIEYRVQFNTEESESFKSTRSLRRGDPLPPCLFLLCMEGLTALLTHAEEDEMISKVKACRDAPAITNLLFADDLLIPMRSNIYNAEALKLVMDSNCAASRQW
jgi:hypothetical protein